MALPPSGPRNGGVGDIRGRVQRPAVRRPARVAPAEEAPQLAPSAPARGFRLRTATTDADIDRQIARLLALFANDNIDPNAPPGSYINFLI